MGRAVLPHHRSRRPRAELRLASAENPRPGESRDPQFPSSMKGPMLAGLPKNVQPGRGPSVPFPPRLGRPEEYAQLVLDLCCNVMMNGSVVRLDGALRI